MQNSKNFIVPAFCAVLLMSCFSFVMSARSPETELLDLTSLKTALEIESIGSNIYWISEKHAIVAAGKTESALPLFEKSTDKSLYILFPRTSAALEGIKNLGDCIEIEPGIFAAQLRADSLENLPNQEFERFLLGEAFAYSFSNAPIDIPSEVTWNSFVQEYVDQVSQDSLMADLTSLVNFVTRQSYTEGCMQAKDWLVSQYSAMEYNVTTQDHTTNMAPNVIAELTGLTLPEEIILICGHFDSTSGQPSVSAPGADDNATGTCTALQAARVFAGSNFERTIRFASFSGEEQGLHGSRAYATQIQNLGENLIAVFNFDMIGWVEPAPEDLDCIGNQNSTDLIDYFRTCAQTYTDLPTRKLIDGSMTYSDHSPFWSRGYKAMCGIEDEPINYPYYHKVTDTVDKVNAEFFTKSTRAAIAAVAHLASPMPGQIFISEHSIDDSAGDGDGFADANEVVQIVVQVRNNLTQSSGEVNLELSCTGGSEYVTILNGHASINSVPSGGEASNSSQPFRIQANSGTPEFTDLEFEIAISCDEPHMASYSFQLAATSYSYHREIFLWNLNSDPQWSKTGTLWDWGQPTGQGGGEHGNSDPETGHSGNSVIGTVLDGDYPPNSTSTIQSHTFNCSEIRNAELRFWRWLNVEQPRYDEASVWIDNGSGFERVWINGSEMTDSAWTEVVIDISDWADAQPSVRFQFYLKTDQGWEYSGWNLDDIEISGLSPGPTIPSPTPHPNTPTPTPTPKTDVGVKLSLNDVDFTAGEPFLLTTDSWNNTPYFQRMPLYILLDIAGQYFFWPSWSLTVDYRTLELEPGIELKNQEILNFIWPDGAGSLEGLRFWAAFTDMAQTKIMGSYDMIEWAFH